MKLIVKNTELAKKALKTNRDFTVGQILSGSQNDLEVIYHSCPEAFEQEGMSKATTLPEKREEKQDKIEKRKDKKFKKFNQYKHKSW